MSWTKRQLIQTAYEEIGITYVFDLQPEMMHSGLKRLESIMATWNADGVLIGYPIASNPDNADLDEDSNIPDHANQAVYSALAIALAPSYGKAISPQLAATANKSYKTMIARNTKPLTRESVGTVTGAGNESGLTGVFFPATQPTLETSTGQELEF